ncbi:hypothetical protein PG994_003341 [Apiospora phragmitis]|uniref:Uncharacterized protein n=1 Tax=Apiospora phragmitis TaxID=2905665 RepID=A0ABR1W1P5_9PEZI
MPYELVHEPLQKHSDVLSMFYQSRLLTQRLSHTVTHPFLGIDVPELLSYDAARVLFSTDAPVRIGFERHIVVVSRQTAQDYVGDLLNAPRYLGLLGAAADAVVDDIEGVQVAGIGTV